MLSSVISNGLAENGPCVILHCQYSFCYLIHCKSKFSISCEPASFAKVKGVLPLLSFISRSAQYSKKQLYQFYVFIGNGFHNRIYLVGVVWTLTAIYVNAMLQQNTG